MEMNQNQIMELLDTLYAKSINGIPKVSQPIDVLANDYLSKNNSIEKAAKQFVNYQVAKCTTSGFVTGLGGLITLPVAIPANVSSVMYVQIRMIACLAYIGGYDTNSDQVQTLVYACLAGISIDQIIKQAGITKFGEKGIINIVKLVPVVGGVIGGGFDLLETKVIANRAYKMFIKGDFSALDDKDDDEIIDVDIDNIETPADKSNS